MAEITQATYTRLAEEMLVPKIPPVDPYAELKATEAAGKIIQLRLSPLGPFVDLKWKAGWTAPASDYRVKPGLNWRPWTIEEVPVGAVIRYKDRAGFGVVILAKDQQDNTYSWVNHNGVEDADISRLDKDMRYSTDCGKTWQPCGVYE